MANVKARSFNFSFFCEHSGELEHVNGSTSTFKCPSCGLTMKYVEANRKLGAHGKTEKTLKHTMRVVEELSEEPKK